MLRHLPVAGLALCLISAPALAGTPLTCTTIPADSTFASLQKAFGAANVTTASVPGAEGQDVQTTVLFAKDKTKRIIVFWKNEKARKGIESLIVRRDETANPTNWDVNGLTVASNLADIEKLNGAAFEISGFGWDYGGFVTKWNGGKLQSLPGGCQLMMRLEPGEDGNSAAIEKVSGESTFKSSDANMKAARPRITEITLSFK